jgi:hypothetical protein
MVNPWGDMDESRRFCFDVDGKVIYALALSLEHFSEICDVVLRLLMADGSDVFDVRFSYVMGFHEVCINATSLASLMEQCQGLKVLTLDDMLLDENLCRVLTAIIGSKRSLNPLFTSGNECHGRGH